MTLSLSRVTKRFGNTVAVDDVSLEIDPGEILGLVGENGAGKTTLMRIAAGEIAADSGVVRGGTLGFVHQHFVLVNEFTIAENLALALGTRVIPDVGIELRDSSRRVSELSVGERAKLELIKAMARKPEVLILDEPTSVLTPLETEELFTVMRRLAANGTSIVFISHKIPEVIAVGTRLVVMRRGRVVAEGTKMTADELARAMVDVGPALSRPAPAESRSYVALQVESLNLTVAAGEIVAIIGVAGNGQAELAAMLRRSMRGPRVAFIPEDRTRDGVIAEMTVAENIALAGVSADAATLVEKFGIGARDPLQRAGTLSGGNQQKLVLARELARHPEVIVAAEPTRGLDIEATFFVHDQLRSAAARGTAVLLITSDLDEAFALAGAIHVIYRGRLSERLTPSEAADRAALLMAGVA